MHVYKEFLGVWDAVLVVDVCERQAALELAMSERKVSDECLECGERAKVSIELVGFFGCVCVSKVLCTHERAQGRNRRGQ